MHLPAPTNQSSKYTAGAITVAEAIIMDGVEAIITDGAIITIGEDIAALVVIVLEEAALTGGFFYDGCEALERNASVPDKILPMNSFG
jgi:hypothetical protein